MKIIVEYIWIDGQKPTTKMRSKTRVLDLPEATLENIPPPGVSTVPAPARPRPGIAIVCCNRSDCTPIRSEVSPTSWFCAK